MSDRKILLGDIHGQTAPVENVWRRLNKNVDSSDVMILLGDVGANYYLTGRDSKFKKKLGNFGFTYFCIRGNHEERPENCAAAHPDDWHQEDFFGNKVWVENKFPYIKYALDQPAVYNINDKSALVIPGAYSVDKDYRLQRGWTWFKDEQLSYDERVESYNLLNKTYNYVFSHTCPASWMPYIQDLFLSQLDQGKIDKTMENYLQYVATNIHWDHWYFGHFHDDRDIGSMKATMLFHQELFLGESFYSSLVKSFKKKG